MDLISLVLYLAVAGFLVWLIVTYIPMPDPIKQTIIVLVVICMVVLIIRILLPGVFTVPRL
jgi:hypothetical protein